MIKTKIVTEGMLSKTVTVDDGVQSSTPKAFKRLKIQNEVYDDKDAIADNAKMISLLTSLVSTMYDTFSDEQKEKIPKEQKQLIEYTFSKFKETTTLADKKLAKKGTKFIDGLMDTQSKIASFF